jgi:hypothetical protein
MVLLHQQVGGAGDAAFTKNNGRDMKARLMATVGLSIARDMPCRAAIAITRKRALGCAGSQIFLRDRLDA